MKIVRNGTEYELTYEEMRKIFTTMEREYLIEDVIGKAEEMEIELSDDDINVIANKANKCLENNDSYWESYWMSIEYSIKDYLNKEN